jgi:1-acyl-sn-glycerol-3-phosphate acyltransferase
MKRPPPYLVRRLLIAPAFIVGVGLLLVSLPIWLLVAAFVSRYVPGRWRVLRVAWFLFLYLAMEAILLVVLFAVWVASGFGWRLRSAAFVGLHYRLAAWWLRRIMGSARRTFRLDITVENELAEIGDRPIVVLSRHAGPGDSFLLVDALLNRNRRWYPRIVLKDLLQLDPCVDVVLNRVPTRFVPSTGRAGEAVVRSISELAAGLGPSDALVLFPEGGNFTPARRTRAIERLDEIGRADLAERAREMAHLLPPKPTGALTALAAAPTADVVFVGHVGLEHLSTVRDLWRGIPIDTEVVSRLWHVPAQELPPPDERERWLYDHWAEIDRWIAGHRTDEAPPDGDS